MTIVWLLLTLIGKWLPHTANYSPEIAMVVYLANRYSFLKASVLTIGIVGIADLGVAMLYGYPFFGVWFLVNAGALLAIILCCRRPWSRMQMVDAVGKVGFAALFYWALTNFGVWLNGEGYPMTFAGLMQCYGMALPFLPAQLVSGVVFTVLGIMANHSWKMRCAQKCGRKARERANIDAFLEIMLSSKKKAILNGDTAV